MIWRQHKCELICVLGQSTVLKCFCMWGDQQQRAITGCCCIKPNCFWPVFSVWIINLHANTLTQRGVMLPDRQNRKHTHTDRKHQHDKQVCTHMWLHADKETYWPTMPQTDLWENQKPGGPHTDTDKKIKNTKNYLRAARFCQNKSFWYYFDKHWVRNLNCEIINI